ncbi:MAG: ATP-binding cassette domain-containing protein, partial [Gammaproteobacteria bacterium]|nr:ATP-binding cassette domain-containing protein [Gammaproteobacteria bacterium]
KVMQASELVELNDFLHRKPAELSGGQRQRVALARAIVREPTVFLMDEPLSNLDAKLRVSTRAQIKNLQNKLRVTTIYVTHDQVEAMTLADRVVVMKAGVIQQVGTPQEIYNKPTNSFVASFIGSPAMNLLKGSISDGVFTCDGVKIEGLSKKHQGNITLGFRAEDAVIVKSKSDISAPAFSMELLGDMTMVSMKVGSDLISIKSDKSYHTEIGSVVSANISANLCLLFDSKSGQMLEN